MDETTTNPNGLEVSVNPHGIRLLGPVVIRLEFGFGKNKSAKLMGVMFCTECDALLSDGRNHNCRK